MEPRGRLLTEVPPGFILPDYRTTELRHPTMRPTEPDEHYAAVSVIDDLDPDRSSRPTASVR